MIRRSAIALAALRRARVARRAAQVEAGMLECRGTDRELHRRLGHRTALPVPSAAAAPRRCRITATIRRVGVDIALPANVGDGMGGVRADPQLGPGDLAGTYGGASASATVGVGVGANVLVGGSNNTIALQPVSLQGQTGLGVAAGVAGLELRPSR